MKRTRTAYSSWRRASAHSICHLSRVCPRAQRSHDRPCRGGDRSARARPRDLGRSASRRPLRGARPDRGQSASGRIASARDLLEAFERKASRSEHELELMAVARCRGLLADEAHTDAVYVEAFRLCDGARWPLERARCHLAYGERLRRSGQRVAARTQLRNALETFIESARPGSPSAHARNYARPARHSAPYGRRARATDDTRTSDRPPRRTRRHQPRSRREPVPEPKDGRKTPLQRLSQAGRALAQRTGTTALRPVGKSSIRGRPRLPQVSGLPRRDAPPARRRMGETIRHAPDLRGGDRHAIPVLHDARPPAPT